ncbi:MFS transporter [Streptomyces sp. M19]
MGMWVVHIPVVEHRAGVSHAVLGWLLLVLGGGAFLGMRLVGPLTDRYGAHRVVPASGALCGAAVVLPGLATSGWALGVALLLLGFGNGCLDVSMNTHAVRVERATRARSCPPSTACSRSAPSSPPWSAPGPSAGTGARPRPSAGRPRSWSSRPSPPPGTAPAGTGGPYGRRASDRDRDRGRGGGGGHRRARRAVPRRIWALAGLALMLMLSEGVANDWSVLHLRDVLDASPRSPPSRTGRSPPP